MSASSDAVSDRLTEPFREKVILKCAESVAMKEAFFARYAEALEAMSREMARRFQEGGKLFAMGNGGSLCDARFIVPSYSIHRIQEVHATAVHIMWDLVHIALGEEDVT
jgi:phosphoheptose isomerase